MYGVNIKNLASQVHLHLDYNNFLVGSKRKDNKKITLKQMIIHPDGARSDYVHFNYRAITELSLPCAYSRRLDVLRALVPVTQHYY